MAQAQAQAQAQRPEPRTWTDAQALEHASLVFQVTPNTTRNIFELTWYRNILYYLGEQWIDWYMSTSSFGRRYPLTIDIPTPVSNIIRDYVRTIKALILNKRYSIRVWPNSNEQADKDASKLGESLLRHLDQEDCSRIEDIKEFVAMWMILTGNGFCRTMASTDNGKYVQSRSGAVVTNKGDIVTENLIPFNVITPLLGEVLELKSFVGIKSLKAREWVEDTHKVLLSHTGGATSDALETVYQRELMELVSNVSPWKGRSLEGGGPVSDDSDMEDLVVYKEIEYRPTVSFPRGRHTVMCEGKLLASNTKLPLPVSKDGTWSYSVTHFPYNYTPGGFLASGGVDDLISPQNIINEVDQDLQTNRQSLGRPMVLTPKDLVLKRRSAAGSKLLQIQWDPQMSAGAKPEIRPGTPYPSQVLEERALHREAAQEASGDPKNILRGHSPQSGASGIMVDILRESAEQSHGPDIMRFYRNWNRVSKKRLMLAQTLYSENRMLKIEGEGNSIYVRKFKGSELSDNTDVRLELDSGLSTTHAGRTQAILKLIEQGFFGDVAQRPQLQRELLRRFGLAGFPDEQNIHKERAEWENSIIIESSKDSKEIKLIAVANVPVVDPATGEPLQGEDGALVPMFEGHSDPLFEMDNDAVHIQTHDIALFGREFQTLPEESQLLLIAHRLAHTDKLEAKRQAEEEHALRLQQAAKGGGAGGAGAGMEPGAGGASSGGGGMEPGLEDLAGPGGMTNTGPAGEDFNAPGGGVTGPAGQSELMV